MKKQLTLITLGFLGIGLLSGCGSKPSPAEQQNQAVSEKQHMNSAQSVRK